MQRGRLVVVTIACMLVAVLAGCQSNPAADAGGADAEPGGARSTGPAVIETAFGPITPPDDPERVIAIGWGDAETALALGVQPIAASDWLDFGGSGVGPWAEDLYDEPPQLLGTLELGYEQVAALQPDLILNTKAAGDPERQQRLSEIAPTVGIPPGATDYTTGMQRQVTMIGTALGVPDKAEQLLSEADQRFADAAAEHPAFDGKTVAVAARTGQGWGAYISETDRVQFLEKLGFDNSPGIDAMEPEGFSVPISTEQLDLLDADLLVVMPIGVDSSEIDSDPIFQRIPAVRDGRYLILDDPMITKAYTVNSMLSISYALEHVTPQLAEAVHP